METPSSQICANLPIYQPPGFNSFSTQTYDLSLQQHPVFSLPPTFAQPLLQISRHDTWLRNTQSIGELGKMWYQRSIREVLWDRINNILNLLSTLYVSSIVLRVLCVLTHFGNELWARLLLRHSLFLVPLRFQFKIMLDILLHFIYRLYFPSFFKFIWIVSSYQSFSSQIAFQIYLKNKPICSILHFVLSHFYKFNLVLSPIVMFPIIVLNSLLKNFWLGFYFLLHSRHSCFTPCVW